MQCGQFLAARSFFAIHKGAVEKNTGLW